MKKILVISYFFPPTTAVGGGVIRVLKFIKYLPLFGFKPYIITVKDSFLPNDETLLTDIPNQAVVIRAGQFDFRYLFSLSERKNNKNKNIEARYKKSVFNKIMRLFLFPDTAATWIIPALLKGLALIKKNDIDIIFVSTPPFSSIIIAYILKRITNKPLVIDYRDLLAIGRNDHNAPIVFRGIRKIVELNILKNADAVINTCNQASKILIKKSKNMDPSKFCVITNGFDSDDISFSATTAFTDTFKIYYAGYLYASRTPFKFFEVIKDLIAEQYFSKKILIKIIGRIENDIINDSSFSFLLEKGYLIIEKCLPHRDAMKLLEVAYVLLLTSDKKVESMIPGKIFEYIALNKPILAIAEKNSEVLDLVEKLHLGAGAAISDKESIKRAVEELFNKIYSNDFHPVVDKDILDSFERRSLTKKLAEIFTEVNNTRNKND